MNYYTGANNERAPNCYVFLLFVFVCEAQMFEGMVPRLQMSLRLALSSTSRLVVALESTGPRIGESTVVVVHKVLFAKGVCVFVSLININ